MCPLYVGRLWFRVYAGLEKSVRFRVSAMERFCYKGFLRNSSGTKFFACLREMSAVEDVRFREVPLYCNCYEYKQIAKVWHPVFIMGDIVICS